MPIHERDPWRYQYFENVACPADVFIPTDDGDAYRWNPSHRWIYNKLRIAESQGLACAPHGVTPPFFPVFSKPIYNLNGMGVGSRRLNNDAEYVAHDTPGHMWMPLLEGEHVSSDVAVIDGEIHWIRHSVGLALSGGTFDYWTIEARPRPVLEDYCAQWIKANLGGYTGMLNLETINDRIIEAHLRFSDQWPDLYGRGWMDSTVRLYSQRIWDFDDADRRTGYSVVLFGPHQRQYRHPPRDAGTALRGREGVSSLQFTFLEDKPNSSHTMPPGGFRLAILNVWDLETGLKGRGELTRLFGLDSATSRGLRARN